MKDSWFTEVPRARGYFSVPASSHHNYVRSYCEKPSFIVVNYFRLHRMDSKIKRACSKHFRSLHRPFWYSCWFLCLFLFLFLVWSDVKVAFWPKKTNNFGRTGLSRSSAGSWPLAWANARDQDIEMLYYLANNCSVSTLYRFTLKKKLLSDAPQFLAR